MSISNDASNTISIRLPQNRLGFIDIIDADLNAVKWQVQSKGYISRRFWNKDEQKYYFFYLHRIILERKIGRILLKGEYSDHINGNRLDNRRCNLRVATASQNRTNSITRAKSGYKGVVKAGNRWRAQISINGRTRSLGNFDTPELAHAVYLNAANEIFGEFVRKDT